MKTCIEIKFMPISAPDVDTANKIISENYDFISFAEKIGLK